MPIFEYVCKKHGKFDAYVPKKYQVLLCPICKKKVLLLNFQYQRNEIQNMG